MRERERDGTAERVESLGYRSAEEARRARTGSVRAHAQLLLVLLLIFALTLVHNVSEVKKIKRGGEKKLAKLSRRVGGSVAQYSSRGARGGNSSTGGAHTM